MERREFLKLVPAASLLLLENALFAEVPTPGKIVVLLELKGGNDGLNTVVPAGRDYDVYKRMRPTLAIERKALLPLEDGLGLHPSLLPIHRLWKRKEVAIVRGVGYPDPNRSHFKSIAIWNCASLHPEHCDEGWVSALFDPFGKYEKRFARAVAVGNRDLGPLAGEKVQALTMDSPREFLKASEGIGTIRGPVGHPMLAYVVEIHNRIATSSSILCERLENAHGRVSDFPKTRIGRDLEHVAQLVSAGIRTPLYKVTQTGYDTHVDQKKRHARLLEELAQAIEAFAETMRKIGRWNDVVLMTYSEFGRRPVENGSRGTDHGTAAPHFVIGGAVRGGLYGKTPSLSRLDENGDLIHTTDFRALYSAVSRFAFTKPLSFSHTFSPISLFS